MRLHNIGEVNDFLETVDRCKGDVWLESAEGDKLSLKSSLRRYVAIADLIRDRAKCWNCIVLCPKMKRSLCICLVNIRTLFNGFCGLSLISPPQ